MTLGRNLITTILLAVTIIALSSRMSKAQDQTPSPRMLLNLDLFTAPPGSDRSGQGADGSESTLEQLRALRSMGYLSNDGLPPENDDDSEPPANAASRAARNSQGAQQ
jgi:hypothetical protein